MVMVDAVASVCLAEDRALLRSNPSAVQDEVDGAGSSGTRLRSSSDHVTSPSMLK